VADNEVVYLDVKTLKEFMQDVFVNLQVPEVDAKIIANVLISSDRRGITSHGVQRLKMYYDRIKANIQEPVTKITVVEESETTASLDAGHGMGHVAAYKGMEMAINKARKYGTGAVSVGNSTHFGIAGYYSLMATNADMIGFSMTNARPSIAPTFGIEPMMGTNPLTIGIPTDEPFPFLLDCATSITQRGKIEVLSRTNTPTPKGWVIGNDGELKTETLEILTALKKGTAALLPLGGAGEEMGGHKGYGYAATVEILSSALWGGPFMKDLTLKKGYKLGHFFMAIDVSKFIDIDQFKTIAGTICRTLRASEKAPGQERIYTAGQKEYEMEQKIDKTGVPLNESIQNDLLIMKKELKLDEYDFPF
jgi:LDH2 family malate/lactate/ureidoglycolate dehydrogenase